MRTRRLVLAKETLSELANDELADVGGAAVQAITPGTSCIFSLVIQCRSVFQPCPTI